MKKTLKQMLALVLALVLTLSMAACGTTEPDPTTGKTEPPAGTSAPDTSTPPTEFDPLSVTKGVTLTVAVPMNITVEDWETNATTLAIQEALGVELEFEVYASADYTEKLNVMINGGDKLPDIILGYQGSGAESISAFVTDWGINGALADLTEYITDPVYTPNIHAVMEAENDYFLDRAKDAEGNIWYFPTYIADPYNGTPYNLMINKDFVEKLGKTMPTNTDEFLELARAFKAAGDVNGNGEDDEVFLTGRGDNMRWFNCLMSSFIYAWGDNYLVEEDGKLTFAYTTDEWKEGLKWLNTFFEEGLIDTGALTNDKNAYNAILQAETARVMCDVYYYAAITGKDTVDQINQRISYQKPILLTSPVNSDPRGHYDPADPVATAVVTADCQNVEAAVIVLDYMCNEELSLSSGTGWRGIHWDYAEDFDASKFTDEADRSRKVEDYISTDPARYEEPLYITYGSIWGTSEQQNWIYMGIGPRLYSQKLYYGGGVYKAPNMEPTAEANFAFTEWKNNQTAASMEIIPDNIVTEAQLKMTAEELDELADIKTTLKNYVTESIGAFLTGQWDVEADWAGYIAELEKIGVSKALELYQTAYERTIG